MLAFHCYTPGKAIAKGHLSGGNEEEASAALSFPQPRFILLLRESNPWPFCSQARLISCCAECERHLCEATSTLTRIDVENTARASEVASEFSGSVSWKMLKFGIFLNGFWPTLKKETYYCHHLRIVVVEWIGRHPNNIFWSLAYCSNHCWYHSSSHLLTETYLTVSTCIM